MNILSNLNTIVSKSKKRLGRGYGSGKGGHTSGRGAKGDKARGKTKITFDGSKIKKSWIKRTPFLRGKHRLLPKKISVLLTLSQLDSIFSPNDLVTPQNLAKKLNLPLRQIKSSLKILSGGKITKALTIEKIPLSRLATKKIIKAGGKISQ
jgi:large subunit ribosomal protein L15